jgi:hypothetical protein
LIASAREIFNSFVWRVNSNQNKIKRNQIISEREFSTGEKILKARIVAVGADNTTDRRFRQLERNILWSRVDFFLTSFPLPTILPNQTRGKIGSMTTYFLASINGATGRVTPKT